ncbi:interferon alpha/beta receptor 1 [Ornithorhynchus anatinus]|uniref:interferon alpha/beta receptor 1 n=1 Tax=Ornithorhynchus anatinus TaxID=9258 RepID=UPI0010A79723|nr:interferon alpha/beta receptor 1 [Ornithorhynchus anatinus]
MSPRAGGEGPAERMETEALAGLFPRLLVLLSLASGGKNLEIPQDVQVSIIDSTFILHWSVANGFDTDVTFSAYYQEVVEEDTWKPLPGCQNVTETNCDFSEELIFQKLNVRVRAERGRDASPWSKVIGFVPFLIEVELESRDGAVFISVSPKSNQILLDNEILSFTYELIIWKNSSSEEKTSLFIHPRDEIHNLAPETTYCLKVRMLRRKKTIFFSPVFCINTTVEKPRPRNLDISAINTNYILKWDYPNEDGSFRVQWLYGFYKKYLKDYTDKWKTVSSCENIKATKCDFSGEISETGIYYLRVQAIDGKNSSLWSQERKFNPSVEAKLGPPSLKVESRDTTTLHVYIADPGEAENKSMSKYHSLMYEVIVMDNSSKLEKKMVESKKSFRVPDLKPLTDYCFKAKVYIKDDKNNRSSNFSNVVCAQTKPGRKSILLITLLVCAAIFFLIVLPVAFFSGIFLWRSIKYVFYPSCKPPSIIGESLYDHQLKNVFLITSEEQTESCYIIENASTSDPKETSVTDKNYSTCSTQSSQDSGNYSYDSETPFIKGTEEIVRLESM